MKPPRRRTSKDTPSKLAKRMSRRWRVVLLRAKGGDSRAGRGTRCGSCQSCRSGQFELDDIQRNRIILQELA